MAKFTQAMRTVLMLTMMAGLSGCGEEAPPPPPPPPPLTVGGSVSGLAGAVVLQLNGADELTVSADGRFKFPKALPKGSAYAVAVKTQPSSPVHQTCTVGQGNGNMGGTPVNNVAVACTTDSSMVGGTVKGLSGKKAVLVLELKGVKEVEIAKNGNFVFPDVRLPDGSDFNVAIKKTPAGHSCVIDAINTAADSDTLNIVAVTCKKIRSY